MTDRELLEAAAKAAGYPLGVSGDGFFIAGTRTQEFKAPPLWNPLTDDGDALRLALKLCISVMPEADAYPPYVLAVWYVGKMAREDITDRQDRYAAARRAIVTAAVAVGEWPAAHPGPREGVDT